MIRNVEFVDTYSKTIRVFVTKDAGNFGTESEYVVSQNWFPWKTGHEFVIFIAGWKTNICSKMIFVPLSNTLRYNQSCSYNAILYPFRTFILNSAQSAKDCSQTFVYGNEIFSKYHLNIYQLMAVERLLVKLLSLNVLMTNGMFNSFSLFNHSEFTVFRRKRVFIPLIVYPIETRHIIPSSHQLQHHCA